MMVWMRWATFLVTFCTFYLCSDLIIFFLQPIVNLLAILVISWLVGKFAYRQFVLKQLGEIIEGSPDLAVFITGCDSGFGLLSAERLQRRGFFVFALCLSKESAGAKKLSSLKNTHIIEGNVTKDEDVTRARKEVDSVLNNNNTEDRGPKQLHAIVNNAGIAIVGMIEWSKTIKDMQAVLDVNLYGVIRVTKAFLPLIRKSRGRIINIASAAARETAHAMTSYTLSKTAVSKFSECLDLEVAEFGVKVITIEPFFFRTDIVNPVVHGQHLQKQWDEADEEVKQSYKGIDKILKLMQVTNSSFLTDPNPGKVVDIIEEGVTSIDPDSIYRPGFKVALLTLSLFLPYEALLPFRRLLGRLLMAAQRFIGES
jgi:NAD(P)-dependent dehydrogenase (short-subunit alcohol dehydrogenase family)